MMTFFDRLNLRPSTRSREIRLPNDLLDTIAVEPEPMLVPLPLAIVLRNIDALRVEGNDRPFDLFHDWIEPRRAALAEVR